MLQPAHTGSGKFAQYEQYLNLQWVRLLDILRMNATYARGSGTILHITDRRAILDFGSGPCVHDLGQGDRSMKISGVASADPDPGRVKPPELLETGFCAERLPLSW